MTATTAGTTNPDESQPTAVTARMRHPLDSLTAEEISHARAILVRAGLVGETTRFPLMSLAEPTKAAVLDRSAWPSLDRVVETVLLDAGTGEATLTQVSLTEDRLLARRAIDVAVDGQPPLTQEEMETVGEVVKADQRWQAAITARGIADVDLVCVCPLSAGNFDVAGERGRRLVRCLSFARNRPTDSPWAHPIDGLVAYVDLISRTVVDLLDREIMPVPAEEGNFDPDSVAPLRSTLRPIEITQPEGPSFSVDGPPVPPHQREFGWSRSAPPRHGWSSKTNW